MTNLAKHPFPCRAVLPRAIAINADDEDHVEVGDRLLVPGVARLGYVTAIRQHGKRPEWSVLELDRAMPDGLVVRGGMVTAERES